MSKEFKISEIMDHKTPDKGIYVVIDSGVYDVTGFVDEHPGGAKILKRVAGRDASKQFWRYHNEGVLKKYAGWLRIGTIKEETKL